MQNLCLQFYAALTDDQLRLGLSTLAQTADGGYAFVALNCAGRRIVDLSILDPQQYSHLQHVSLARNALGLTPVHDRVAKEHLAAAEAHVKQLRDERERLEKELEDARVQAEEEAQLEQQRLEEEEHRLQYGDYEEEVPPTDMSGTYRDLKVGDDDTSVDTPVNERESEAEAEEEEEGEEGSVEEASAAEEEGGEAVVVAEEEEDEGAEEDDDNATASEEREEEEAAVVAEEVEAVVVEEEEQEEDKIPDPFSVLSQLPALLTLDLSSNGFQHIPATAAAGLAFQSLRVLDLSGNQITSVDTSIAAPELLRLNLSFNRLSALSNSAAQARVQATLAEETAQMAVHDDGQGGRLHMQQQMQLQQMHIPGQAQGAGQQQQVRIQGPRLVGPSGEELQGPEGGEDVASAAEGAAAADSTEPDDFADCISLCPSLQQLELRENQLLTLKHVRSTSLKRLYAAANQLREIDVPDGTARSLTHLHLRLNNVHSVRALASGKYESLGYLNLRENAISSMEELQGLRYCRKLTSVVLQGNPLQDQVPNYRLEVLSMCPTLQYIDSAFVTAEELAHVESIRAMREQEALEGQAGYQQQGYDGGGGYQQQQQQYPALLGLTSSRWQ